MSNLTDALFGSTGPLLSDEVTQVSSSAWAIDPPVTSGDVIFFVHTGATEPQWAAPLTHRAAHLQSLPPGWDSYAAQRVQGKPLALALRFLDRVMRPTTVLPALVPTARGGVQLEWHTRGIDLEVAFQPSGNVHIFFEDPTAGDEWEGELGLESSYALERALKTLS